MLTLTFSCAIVCSLAAFAGGFIDAISGGGGLLVLPSLLLMGVPPHFALGTSKIASFMGTAITLYNYARHGLVLWKIVGFGIGFCIVGAWFGSWLALRLDAAVLGKVIFVILPIAMLIALMPQKNRTTMDFAPAGLRFWLVLPAICFGLSIYDGLIGPGTGSFLIILLNWLLGMNLIAASANAKAFNLASNLGAVVSFVWHGSVFWPLGILMAACFMLGGWIGSAFAIHKGSGMVRKFLIFSLSLLMLSLFWKYFIAPGQ